MTVLNRHVFSCVDQIDFLGCHGSGMRNDEPGLTDAEIAKLKEILARNRETGGNEFTMETEYDAVDLD